MSASSKQPRTRAWTSAPSTPPPATPCQARTSATATRPGRATCAISSRPPRTVTSPRSSASSSSSASWRVTRAHTAPVWTSTPSWRRACSSTTCRCPWRLLSPPSPARGSAPTGLCPWTRCATTWGRRWPSTSPTCPLTPSGSRLWRSRARRSTRGCGRRAGTRTTPPSLSLPFSCPCGARSSSRRGSGATPSSTSGGTASPR
mmetsp:Transcript_12242/g.36535  ORF Transcript_12242/g.36535 Transcript_12242/m.36535 type:complete len:203 (-) Transcript_12242:1917-2525(-)